MVQEQVQLSDLTPEERAARDGAELGVEHVYHDLGSQEGGDPAVVTEFHEARAVAVAAAVTAEAEAEGADE